MTTPCLLSVVRIYNQQGYGFKAIGGLISFDNLELRSGAYKYMHIDGNKVYVGDTGAELIFNYQHEKFIEKMELLNFKIDVQSKIVKYIQTDWKE